jgi:hypothetical protein
LEEAKDTSICMMIPEFGTVMEKAGPMIYTTMCDLFDGKKNFSEETIGRGKKLLEAPIVNMLGATTPDWIVENMTKNQISGGFGSRTIWIYEKDAREPVLIHRKRKNRPKQRPNYKQLEANLIADLAHIASNIEGPFEITDRAQDFLEDWYQELVKGDKTELRSIKGIIHRSPAYVLKLAMLYKLAQTDTLVLDIEEIEWAIHNLKVLHATSLEAFRNIGANPFTLTIEGMKDYMAVKKKAPRSELLKVFNSEAEPFKLTQLIEGLVMQGVIEIDFKENANDPTFTWVDKD